jgi:hypothetical protein
VLSKIRDSLTYANVPATLALFSCRKAAAWPSPSRNWDLSILSGGAHIFGQHSTTLSRFWTFLGFSTS